MQRREATIVVTCHPCSQNGILVRLVANGSSSFLFWLGRCWAGEGLEGHLGKWEARTPEMWESQSLVGLSNGVGFPLFLLSFSRAPGVSGRLSFVPQSSHMDGALSKLLSFTAAGEWVACGSVPMFLCSQCPPRPHAPWPFPAGLTGALRVCLWFRCGRGPGFGHTGLEGSHKDQCVQEWGPSPWPTVGAVLKSRQLPGGGLLCPPRSGETQGGRTV